jgi:polyhydroxyalkanoate synthesis regulator phasin
MAQRGGSSRKGSGGRSSGSSSRSSSGRAAGGARRAGIEAKTVAEFRDALRKNLIRPFDIVLLSRDRIEEVLGEAVDRGRVTADDAQSLANRLLQRGRKQTNDVLKDLEQLMGRGRDRIEGRTSGVRRAGGDAARGARRQVEGAARGARTRAVKAADPVLAQADRVRRTAGVGPNFPVTGYDDLTAAQIQSRLTGLTPAELRKVRDYERRHANRKTVLNSIEEKLG